MMDEGYEERERVWSILRGGEESFESNSSITDFKQDLDEEALAHEEVDQHKITVLLRDIVLPLKWMYHKYLIKFWRVVKVAGSHHYLSSSHHPFHDSGLHKGLDWSRELYSAREYVVDIGEGGDREQLGSVGRVYRNKLPESTPDLRLYSTHEFPMRDEAARCGFRAYMALPLFDSHSNQYYGVLELFHSQISNDDRDRFLSLLERKLQIAGLMSNHNSIAIKKETLQQPVSEIAEVLELAVATIPRLYLAQVWIPGNSQCLHNTTNLCCMEMLSFIDSQSKKFNSWCDIGDDMHDYLQACEFHKFQMNSQNHYLNLRELTIYENSLAHYAHRARMSHYITVAHQSNNNHLHFIQFFLRPKYIQDAHSLHLLLKLLGTNLKSVTVMFVSGKQLVEEYLKRDAIECKSIFSLKKSDKQNFLELNMTTYLKTADSCCLKPTATTSIGVDTVWVFSLPATQSVCKNHVKSNSLVIKEKMEDFMKKLAVKSWKHSKWIVQFWAPKMGQNRCYLETSDQPYVVGCLAKGIASFRKKCTENYYFVDDQAKQDELGPPGRVFRSKHPESSPDLLYYTREEFPTRNFAMLCCNRGYIALPVCDDYDRLVGVLELLGFYYSDLQIIEKLIKEENLYSTRDFYSRFVERPINYCRNKALSEIKSARVPFLKYMDLPQLHMTNVWVPIAECDSTTNSNMSCMELMFCSKIEPTHSVRCIHVQARKGIVGMALSSENKSCFCPNLSEFSIVDQPLSHYDMSDRRDACFAICLQSSHTGNLVYVFEFFLYQGHATHKYVWSFLSLLYPILKSRLSSFRMACGKEIGEELVVEVIEFSDANKLDSSELESACVCPVIFKSVQYNQKVLQEEEQNENHHLEEEQQNEYHHTGEQHAEEYPVDASHPNTRDRGKGKKFPNLSAEILKSHFGMELKDAAEKLCIGRSTLKRACRFHGIPRWPSRKQYKKNPSLFEEKSAADSKQDMLPSTNNFHSLENVTQINTGSADKVIVKVEYNKDSIKFVLSLPLLGLARLTEEVAKNLNLEMGSFKLKYKDEDEDEILLTRDADLQLCPTKTRKATGETIIKLLVR